MPSYERRNDSKHRPAVFARDLGFCQICKLNIVALSRLLFPRWPVSPEHLKILEEHPWTAKAYRIEDLWQCDHIIPVTKGGALGDSSSLDNLRTLCLPCHKEQTKIQAAQRARLPKKKYKRF